MSVIRQELNPLFPGINPEPIELTTKAARLQEVVVKENAMRVLLPTGMPDRLGAVAKDGELCGFPQDIFGVAAPAAGA